MIPPESLWLATTTGSRRRPSPLPPASAATVTPRRWSKVSNSVKLRTGRHPRVTTAQDLLAGLAITDSCNLVDAGLPSSGSAGSVPRLSPLAHGLRTATLDANQLRIHGHQARRRTAHGDPNRRSAPLMNHPTHTLPLAATPSAAVASRGHRHGRLSLRRSFHATSA